MLTIPGPDHDLDIRLYRPDVNHPVPVLVYFHGGGWVRGTLDSTDWICRRLTDKIGCLVASVDYRLAPEHPFPAAVEDAYAATAWLGRNANHLGGDPSRLGVVGHSAGGNLSAVVSLLAVQRDDPILSLQVLLNPVTDFSFDTESYRTFDLAFWSEHCPRGAAGYPLSKEDMEWYCDHYLRSPVDRVHPYAAPLRAPSLTGVPPAIVVTSEYDPLREDGNLYARRLRDADIPVDHVPQSESLHGYIVNQAEFPSAVEALDALAATVRDRLVGSAE